MSARFWQYGVARPAAILAALVLLLPPVPGRACACLVKGDRQTTCSHCSRRAADASPGAARTCCAKHRDVQRKTCCQRHTSLAQDNPNEQSAVGPVCQCHHGQTPHTPVAPVNQSQLTVDQLLQMQAAVSQPLPVTTPPLTALSANQDRFLSADTSLERCVRLSRLTL